MDVLFGAIKNAGGFDFMMNSLIAITALQTIALAFALRKGGKNYAD